MLAREGRGPDHRGEQPGPCAPFRWISGNCLRLRPLVPRIGAVRRGERRAHAGGYRPRCRAGGADAVLVGETLMRSPGQEGGAGRAAGGRHEAQVKICGLTRPEDTEAVKRGRGPTTSALYLPRAAAGR